MHRFFRLFLVALFLAALAFGQTTAINGTVTDPSGAVMPNAIVTIVNTETGAQRETTSDSQGRYNIQQVVPGTYKLVAKASGFTDVTINNLKLQVNLPATVPVVFAALGSTTTTVEVAAAGTQINTVDASIGNVIGGNAIVELPSYARNVANLLSFQPGVAYFGGDPSTDDRNGAVNGGRSDQGNITLDGADVNQQSNRAALTSVLRVTPDSVQEFRTTTSNGGADGGRGSGADIVLVTKSGTNDYHGSLYEYRRGTETAANSFFNNKSGVPRAPLLINLFGGAVGGPIKKNKAFFFANYEGRRDASSTNVTRTVPVETMKQGIVLFHTTSGALTQIGPTELKTLVDPKGIGIDQAALDTLKMYPAGNALGGDGVNTTGFRFNAPQHSKQDTYIAKLDYNLTDKNSLFWRGNLQNDHANGTPQFPGAQPNSVTLANNKGMAAGLTSVVSSSLVNTARYGFTRQGGETTGILAGSYVYFRGIDPIYGTTTGSSRIVPVHTITDDLAWTKGSHDFKFGGVGRFISNASISYAKAYNVALTNSSLLSGSGSDITPTSLGLYSGDRTTYQYTAIALLGIVSQATGNYNYKTDGSVIPSGQPLLRNFVSHEGELYAQDSWRIKNNLTLTYGLRLSIMPPVHEANGQQITTNIPLGTWMDTRGALAATGQSDQAAGTISYLVAGRPYYPQHNNWAPRLAVAYSPKGESGIAKFLFGGPGKTSIRAGAGMYYDLIGQPLAASISSSSFGLATSLSTPPNVYDSTQLPRYTGFYNFPANPATAPLFVPPAPPGGFPSTFPNTFSITSSLDDQLKAPYAMNLNFSIGREFGHGFFVQAAYVGRLSRHNLVQRDLAMPTNLKDPKSGQTYFQAMTQLATLLDLQGVKVQDLPKLPFFENMWATAAGSGFTATQAVAKDYLERSNPGDFTNVLSDMDGGGCSTTGSTYRSNGTISRLGCGVLGPYSMWSPQYSALNAWSSLGSGAYHAMQWTISKRVSSSLTFDFNYTFSKSIDIGSTTENSATFGNDFMINSWNAQQLRAVSRYDATHQANAWVVWDLPFGRGRKYGTDMNKILDAIVGGWELAPTWRQSSGLPTSVGDGSRWATNWQLSAFGTPNGQPVAATVSAHNAQAVSGAGGPNLWTDPKAALGGWQETMAGQTGSRDTLRGEGFFNIDMGVLKSFSMPYNEQHKLQFRAEAFNMTNTVRFDPASASLSLTSTARFGQLTRVLGSARQMQFALRYTF